MADIDIEEPDPPKEVKVTDVNNTKGPSEVKESSFKVLNTERPVEKAVHLTILKDDAKFRRVFAFSMLGLLVAILISSFCSHIVAGMVALQTPSGEFPKALLAAVEEIFPIAFSGVMGVFGTVVGFYFATGEKK
ncbi:hypothetical protein PNH50_04710 [Leisingera aquaemixtae]|uniref:hypothetical protein n=1 Tax=Leisingera aquaemixtae TaxID=1396826 RepID=UPI003983F02E